MFATPRTPRTEYANQQKNGSGDSEKTATVAALTSRWQRRLRALSRIGSAGTTMPTAPTSTGSGGNRQTTTESARVVPTARSPVSEDTQQPRAAGEPRRHMVQEPHGDDDSDPTGEDYVATANTQNSVQETKNDTTGIFVPKASRKQHLRMVKTVGVVCGRIMWVSILNTDDRNKKLSVREVIGTWIPMDDTIETMAGYGELERQRVAEWASTLKVTNAPSLASEEAINIGEMEPAAWAVVVAVLRRFRQAVENKEGVFQLRRPVFSITSMLVT
ncbi:hypothetical protein ON010_g10888 [Phytophthora cinnamomi]|nr:hypothetical protein ON010_g10888 [Phytophthora cinnamomi]